MSHEKGRPPAFKLATAQNSASAMPAQYDWETSRDLPALGSRPAYNASIRLPGILNLFDKVLLFGGARPPRGSRLGYSGWPSRLFQHSEPREHECPQSRGPRRPWIRLLGPV